MTPDQLDHLQLAITNMVLMDDGEEPITMAQLQQDAADNPAEFAKVRERVQRMAAAVLDTTGFGELYDTAAKGFHVSETCGPEGRFNRVSKFQSLQELHDFEHAWRVALTVVRDGR